jgi:hypothetical protein
MGAGRVVDLIPTLVLRQPFRRPFKNPRRMAGDDVFIAFVVHHELAGANVIEQKPGLLKEKVVGRAVRGVVELFDPHY